MSDMEYYSAIKKNVFESVLEPIIQREVSQKEKKISHIYEIQKDGIDELISRAAMETQTEENRLVDTAGEGERGMN